MGPGAPKFSQGKQGVSKPHMGMDPERLVGPTLRQGNALFPQYACRVEVSPHLIKVAQPEHDWQALRRLAYLLTQFTGPGIDAARLLERRTPS